jgi:hypothetical protein
MAVPHFWRVHYGSEFKDFPQRSRANGFAMMMRAQGHSNVYVKPMRYE